MIPLSRAFPTLLSALAFAAPAYPWGREGHMALATVAQQGLSTDARSHVVKILGNDDLAKISVWMDELRTAAMHAGPLAFDPEARQFNQEFPKNYEWHYVDLPLGTKAYELSGPFARPEDVVHSIEQAVSVLEGAGDARITKKEALYMLVHFVGDLHQPLHAACGYYDVAPDGSATLVTDPDSAKGLPRDNGGNLLYYGAGRLDELHAYWDIGIVTRITHSDITADLVKVLQRQVAAEGGGWKSPGDYHHWAEGWATESLLAARTAYQGIRFGPVTPNPKGGILKIMITQPAHYDDTCVPLAQERLAKAAFHLAEILNAIHWPS